MDVGLKANGARQFQISMENQFNNGEFVVTSATKDSQVKILVTLEWIRFWQEIKFNGQMCLPQTWVTLVSVSLRI